VDIRGSSDIGNKTIWTAKYGAIFLPNIGDTDRRCSKALLAGPSVTDEKLDDCNDASDNNLRSDQFLAPLRTVPIADVPDDTIGRTYVKDEVQRKNVRIFHKAKNNGVWTFIDGNFTFDAAALREGLILGIDGRDTRRPGGWDGRVTVSFDVQSSRWSSSDQVILRVAPVLTHTHLDPVQQVLAAKGNETGSPWILRFTNELQKATRNSGLGEQLYLFSASDDIWVQDFMEPGFASMPGPSGPISLRIMIRSPQDERVAGRQLFEYYRDTGIGAVQQLGGARDEINSGGNIETIPPYEFDGVSWPAGRIIMGNHGQQQHFLTPFFKAQETQNPLLLDTDWLVIGHVDEFLQFMPANSPRGWVLMADDPLAGVEMLKRLKDSGHGSERGFSRRNDTESFPGCADSFGCASIPVESTTINEILADEALMTVQKRCAERIEANLANDFPGASLATTPTIQQTQSV
jgi:protein-arginine deiminase